MCPRPRRTHPLGAMPPLRILILALAAAAAGAAAPAECDEAFGCDAEPDEVALLQKAFAVTPAQIGGATGATVTSTTPPPTGVGSNAKVVQIHRAVSFGGPRLRSNTGGRSREARSPLCGPELFVGLAALGFGLAWVSSARLSAMQPDLSVPSMSAVSANDRESPLPRTAACRWHRLPSNSELMCV